MKITVFRLFAAAGLLASASIDGSPAKAETVLRFNLWLPAAFYVVTDFVGGWAKEVEKATAGRVRVENTATSLGAPNRQFQLAVDGVADLVWGSPNYSAGQFPLHEIMSLPFLSQKAEPASVAYWRVYKKHFESVGDFKDVKLVGLHAQAPGQLLLFKNREVRTVDDIKGLKIRTVSGNMSKVIERLGAAPISIPANEIYMMASRGVIDGMQFSAEAAVAFKLETFVKRIVDVPGGYYNSAFYLAMNKRKWAAISVQDQAAIEAVSGEYFSRRVGRGWDRLVSAGYETMKKAGAVIQPAPDAFVQKLAKDSEFIEKEWLGDAAKQKVDGVAALKMLREEIANYKSDQ